jgi:hypothetical protein
MNRNLQQGHYHSEGEQMKMKGLKAIFSATSVAIALTAIISGCGTQQATPSSSKPANTTAVTTTATPSNTTATTSASPQSSDSQAPQAFMDLAITGSGLKLGSDGKTHDTFLPGNFTLEKGVPTQITIANFDEGPHTLTIPELNINIQIPGQKADHVASITKAVVTASKSGTFEWMCNQPCDSKANGWAMTQEGYMRGKVTVVDDNKQYEYITVVGSGVELGSDGKTHDAFLPGNFTFIKDKPVVLQVANYDEGPHTFTVPDLNVNFTIPGHKADNVASVTTFTFTPNKAGTFKWMCEYPCDGKANGWAMTQPSYMQGQVTIQ